LTTTGKIRKKERKIFCYGALFQDFGESNIYRIMHKPTHRVKSESHEMCLFHVWEESTFSRKGMLISRTFFFPELYITVLNKLRNIISLKICIYSTCTIESSCADYGNLGWDSKLFQLIHFSFSSKCCQKRSHKFANFLA